MVAPDVGKAGAMRQRQRDAALHRSALLILLRLLDAGLGARVRQASLGHAVASAGGRLALLPSARRPHLATARDGPTFRKRRKRGERDPGLRLGGHGCELAPLGCNGSVREIAVIREACLAAPGCEALHLEGLRRLDALAAGGAASAREAARHVADHIGGFLRGCAQDQSAAHTPVMSQSKANTTILQRVSGSNLGRVWPNSPVV